MGVWNDLMEQSRSHWPQNKTLLLVGGSVQLQKQLIAKLYVQHDTFLSSDDTNLIANEFHLGYTYIQYRDPTGLLSTLNIYTAPETLKTCEILIRKLIERVNIEDFLFVPLLDYKEDPQVWLKTLKTWISLFDDIFKGVVFNALIITLNRASAIDLDQDVHEFIQWALRIVAHNHQCSLLYTTRDFSQLLDTVASILKINYKDGIRPVLKPFSVDYQEFLIPAGTDKWTKISALNEETNPEHALEEWKLGGDGGFISKYGEKIPPVIKTTKNKPVKVEKITEKRSLKYQDFLDSLYEQTQKSKKSHMV